MTKKICDCPTCHKEAFTTVKVPRIALIDKIKFDGNKCITFCVKDEDIICCDMNLCLEHTHDLADAVFRIEEGIFHHDQEDL